MKQIEDAVKGYVTDLVSAEKGKLVDLLVDKIKDPEFQNAVADKLNDKFDVWGLSEKKEKEIILWVIDLVDDHIISFLKDLK